MGLVEKYRLNIKFILVIVFLVLNPLFIIAVEAAELSKQVVVQSSIERDSNPNMSESNTNPVWIYTLLPQISLALDDDINNWYLNASILYQEPSNQKVMIDRQDPSLALGWDRKYDTGKYGVRFNYSQASSRAVELKSTGVFSDIDNTQKTKSISANWLHIINNRMSILTEAGYTDVIFSQPGSLQNNRVRDFQSKLLYESNEKLTTNLVFSYTHFRPEKQFRSTDLLRLGFGGTYQITDSLTLYPYAGLFSLSGNQGDEGWEAAFKVEFQSDRNNLRSEISRRNSASGIGGSQIVDTYLVGWLFNRSNIDRAGVDFGLSKSKEGTAASQAVTSRQVGAFYDVDLTSQWKTRFYASYKEQEAGASNSHGNLIGISLICDTLSF